MASVIKVAILDDYHNIALPYFQTLDNARFDVTVYRDTLLPYNHPSTSDDIKSQLVERLKPFHVISTIRERTPFPGPLLQQLPNLKLLLTTGLRNASIDLEAAKFLGILVTGSLNESPSKTTPSTIRNQPKGPDSTAQHTAALILSIARNIASDDAIIKQGGWQTSLTASLAGKTFGAAGLGRLGTSVAKIMHQSFGMKIIAWSASLTQEIADQKAREAGLDVEDGEGGKTFTAVGKEELFRSADVVSMHYVLSDRSRGMVGKKELGIMKSGAFFVNTSRGPLVVEEELLDVLKWGRIRGAAIDVFDLEPLPRESEWRTTRWGIEGRSHVLLTPHTGYVEEAVMASWYRQTVENIERWYAGRDLLHPLV
jgi:phosphoglycerate dehydrogenase-like enzyme